MEVNTRDGSTGMKTTRMTVGEFSITVRLVDAIGRSDRALFAKWIRRYGLCLPRNASRSLPLTRSGVIEFSKTLLHNGAPAWPRWQAVRAIESCRNYIWNLERDTLDRRTDA